MWTVLSMQGEFVNWQRYYRKYKTSEAATGGVLYKKVFLEFFCNTEYV